MVNSKQLFNEFTAWLKHADREENHAIAYLIFERILNVTRTEIFSEKRVAMSANQYSTLVEIARELNADSPVQYVLGEAQFFGRTFKVNQNVLIPRPETEELVMEVIAICKARASSQRILDIGTGSGCIAITLALEIDHALVEAMDVSPEALRLAEENAALLKAKIEVIQQSILDAKASGLKYDVIVSNPPYIPECESGAMEMKVLAHEPRLALFVPHDDPLRFYKAIAAFAGTSLHHGGWVALEINRRFGQAVAEIFKNDFENVQIKKDLNGHDRMVIGQKK